MNRFKRLLKTTVNVLFTVLIVLLILVTLTSLLARISAGGNRLFGKYGFGRILTGSMEPDIPTGSFVLVETTPPETLAVGDVIMFCSDDPDVPEGMPVSHRIERIEYDEGGTRRFITKGTANAIEDTYPVYDKAVIGKVVWTSTVLGSIVAFSQQSYIYPVLIVLLLINFGVDLVIVIDEAKALRAGDDHANEN